MEELLEDTESGHNLGATERRPGYKEGPGLKPHLKFYMDAFWDLAADRHDGGSIPWTALDAYARRYRISDLESFERFCALVKALDRAFLQHARPPEKSKSEPNDP